MCSDAGEAEGRVRLLDKEGAAQRIATQNMQLTSERQTAAQAISVGQSGCSKWDMPEKGANAH